MAEAARVNPWLKRELPPENTKLDLILEVEKGRLDDARRGLQRINGVTVRSPTFNFLPVTAPDAAIDEIRNVPGVIQVHYNMPKGVGAVSIKDPLVGKFGLSEVEVPWSAQDAIRANLMRLPLGGPIGWYTGPARDDVEMVPLDHARKLVGAPDDNAINERVAVLDTGAPLPGHPLVKTRLINARSTTGELPFDGLGHGTWCHTSAFMGAWSTRFGPVRGVADAGGNSMHIKCLSNVGFGSTETVLRAMETALKWDAKVISMSLGGPLQGSVDDDPETRIIQANSDDRVWIVAAGNAGGDGVSWNIGSPGASPAALTIGAWSTKYEAVADFSSRGWNGEWYTDHQETWQRDLDTFGSALRKPDVLAPGGGPAGGADVTDLIYSGVQGWMDGTYDLTPAEGFDGMRGTCHPGDTRILAPGRGAVPIRNLGPGDRVYSITDEGELEVHRVNALLDQGTKMVYEVHTRDGLVEATANHPVLVFKKVSRHHLVADARRLREDGWSYADIAEKLDVSRTAVSDWLEEGAEPHPDHQLEWVAVEDLEPGDAIVKVRGGVGTGTTEPPVDLTQDQLRFLGFFLADGWIVTSGGNYQVCLAIGDDGHAETYAGIYEAWTGCEMRSDADEKWYYDYNKAWVDLWRGTGFDQPADEKYVPDWVFGLPDDDLRAFLEGYIDGDGWRETDRSNDAVRWETTSRRLARDIQLLAQLAGWRAWGLRSRSRVVHPPNFLGPVPVTTYSSGATESQARTHGDNDAKADPRRFGDYADEDTFTLTRVTEVRPDRERPVYDIEVDGAHNFVAEGHVVHNSMATPIMAGLVSLLRKYDLARTASDVRARLAETWPREKDVARGYGLAHFNRFRRPEPQEPDAETTQNR